jgi:phosphate transport system substrate-binding protein
MFMKRFSHIFILAALTLGTLLTSCKKETYYTVTLEANGGQVAGGSVITVKAGEPLHIAMSDGPENHDLTGWYKDAGLTEKWNFETDVVTADMTLYAGWERYYTFTYTLHGNGGTFPNEKGEVSTVTVREGYGLSSPDNVIKAGYVLEGWYRNEALTEKWDFDTDVVTADGALYAKWDPSIEGLTRENYPRVDGATSTRALNVMIACKLLGLPYYWRTISGIGESCVVPGGEYMNAAGTFFDGRIKTSQTYGAMLNLIEGKADIILRSTTASPAEKASAEAAGVTLVETPIALDAFVFIKNSANPVQSLTLEQIRKIYTKQITNWSEVGGKNAPMTVFTRPRNSGSEETLRELVMNGLEPAEFSGEQQSFSMVGIVWDIERDANAIGYIFKNYKERIVRRYEPVFAIDGIYPDPATIGNRTYPLTTEVYAIIRSDLDQNSMAYKLYEWLRTSEAAKSVLTECGFVPL